MVAEFIGSVNLVESTIVQDEEEASLAHVIRERLGFGMIGIKRRRFRHRVWRRTQVRNAVAEADAASHQQRQHGSARQHDPPCADRAQARIRHGSRRDDDECHPVCPSSARQAGAYVGKSPRCVRPKQANRPFVTQSVIEATLRDRYCRVALCFAPLDHAREER